MNFNQRVQKYLDELGWTWEILQMESGLDIDVQQHLSSNEVTNTVLFIVISTIAGQYPETQTLQIFHDIANIFNEVQTK